MFPKNIVCLNYSFILSVHCIFCVIFPKAEIVNNCNGVMYIVGMGLEDVLVKRIVLKMSFSAVERSGEYINCIRYTTSTLFCSNFGS